jgi:hypothetical protein
MISHNWRSRHRPDPNEQRRETYSFMPNCVVAERAVIKTISKNGFRAVDQKRS